MGTNLTGKDVKIAKGIENYEEKMNEAVEHWSSEGRIVAMNCIAKLKDYTTM
jgi:hypothetical protein